jgi:hypothetical protein
MSLTALFICIRNSKKKKVVYHCLDVICHCLAATSKDFTRRAGVQRGKIPGYVTHTSVCPRKVTDWDSNPGPPGPPGYIPGALTTELPSRGPTSATWGYLSRPCDRLQIHRIFFFFKMVHVTPARRVKSLRLRPNSDKSHPNSGTQFFIYLEFRIMRRL